MSVRPSINITILQGADFSESFLSQESDSSATDLTGYTAYSQLKKHSSASSSFPFTVGITSSIGEVKISMNGTTTSSIEPGRYVYDVIVSDTVGEVTRVVEGSVLVRQGVTR